MVGAVHGAEAVLLALPLHHRVHGVLVVLPVAGAHVQLALADVGRDDVLVAALDFLTRRLVRMFRQLLVLKCK